jgi:hypothetical protein
VPHTSGGRTEERGSVGRGILGSSSGVAGPDLCNVERFKLKRKVQQPDEVLFRGDEREMEILIALNALTEKLL